MWGGTAIRKFKKIRSHIKNLGESWEISYVPDNVSVVSNGRWKGTSLTHMIEKYGDRLLGQRVIDRFGMTFPLLIKFIDAKEPLSVQVHPNDALAMKRHNSFGKTEMWYVIKAAKDAWLYSGFKEEIDKKKYEVSVKNGTFMNYLQRYDVRVGDAFFLPSGRVHAIGAGCLIAEIQQTSDVTYRIYDYDRLTPAGTHRVLHTKLAKDAIDYTVYPDYRISYLHKKRGIENLAQCPYFTTNLIVANDGQVVARDHDKQSFVIYIALAGHATLYTGKNKLAELENGATVLVPAEEAPNVMLFFHEFTKVLETYIE